MASGKELDRRWQRNFGAGERRRALKERAIAFLGGKCQVCGYNRCASAFDFHHLDPMTKDFNISGKMSWRRIQTELKKTVLLCATCHREVHAGLHPSLLNLEEGLFGPDDYFE